MTASANSAAARINRGNAAYTMSSDGMLSIEKARKGKLMIWTIVT